MTLTIELTPEQESRLAALARQEGMEPAEVVEKLVAEHLPPLASALSSNEAARRVNVMHELAAETQRLGLEETNGTAVAAGDPVERVRALLARWQEEDHTPLAPPVATRPGETPTQALFRIWQEEDAGMTEGEREAEDRLWTEIEGGLDENRGLGLRWLSP